MRLLLDTHSLLWWIEDSPKLPVTARAAVSDRSNDVFVSMATVWEVAIKAGLGRFNLPFDLQRFMIDQLQRNGFTGLPIEMEHACAVRDLPLHHKDPFDRMLIAQSQVERLRLVSDDRWFKAYGVDLVW